MISLFAIFLSFFIGLGISFTIIAIDKKKYRDDNNNRHPELELRVNQLANWLITTVVVFMASVTVGFLNKNVDSMWIGAGIVTLVAIIAIIGKLYSIHVFNLMEDVKQKYKPAAVEAYLFSFWVILLLDKALLVNI
ncbi:hypothetical protein [Pseudomonas phage PA1C]|uniref:Uncharacterized protein n=1 Tax=Pseudomonas phage vB_PaeM_PS119XW TaxID=2601632 RepID=A0A5C1K8U4_9CAUD|nr:hypothetical protein PP933_gp035 [Pseudomonas phage vB_PaeM_PS119XW]QBX32186.1 hypothetical protein [Pseudomonas phage PA1C]QEM41764.1 hypothetical protein [Pseudomonas phage vB_PaeM_PS119XW]